MPGSYSGRRTSRNRQREVHASVKVCAGPVQTAQVRRRGDDHIVGYYRFPMYVTSTSRSFLHKKCSGMEPGGGQQKSRVVVPRRGMRDARLNNELIVLSVGMQRIPQMSDLCEVRRIHLPRTPVNKGKKKEEGAKPCRAPPLGASA